MPKYQVWLDCALAIFFMLPKGKNDTLDSIGYLYTHYSG